MFSKEGLMGKPLCGHSGNVTERWATCGLGGAMAEAQTSWSVLESCGRTCFETAMAKVMVIMKP